MMLEYLRYKKYPFNISNLSLKNYIFNVIYFFVILFILFSSKLYTYTT